MTDNTSSIRQVQREIVDEFAAFGDWMDKYEYLIELGHSLPVIDEQKLWFTADSDAIITKGIISLLIRVYNGRTPDEILSADNSFIEEIGLRENLSPTRANGLVSMMEQIREDALKCKGQ